MIKYSVITPVFNRADCITRCIESVINQINTNELEYEHIIVDDGSRDNTANIVSEYTKKYNHIKFIKLAENKGTNTARNTAIKVATGNYCIILDSDDYFIEDALYKINECIKNKNYKHYLFTPDDRYEVFCNSSIFKENNIFKYADFLSEKITGDFIHIIRTEIMQNNLFDESLRIHEGVFFLRFYKEAQEIYFNNTIVTIRERGRNDSVSKEYITINKNIILNNIKAIEIKINWFENEYIRLKQTYILYKQYTQLLNYYLILGEYNKCKLIFKKIEQIGFHVSNKQKTMYMFRLGAIYRSMLFLYFTIKYKYLNFKTK
ncbi:MAG: glycosyltransferase family 2 protein [Bacteroidaceae bacterium]|nr:glycosyltransferase family 2 protein [Bacteroidaceae bacterium]